MNMLLTLSIHSLLIILVAIRRGFFKSHIFASKIFIQFDPNLGLITNLCAAQFKLFDEMDWAKSCQSIVFLNH